MSDSDNPSSPKKEEMDVSENGDTSKTKEESDQEDSPVKVPPKEEEDNEESEEEEDEEEPPLGLLERPVELTSGKREKKKVERLEVTINLPSAERKKVDIPEGKGTKLGDCPRIEFKINHIKAIELKPLHRLLFNKVASNVAVKKNIRQFSGFPFEKGDKEYDKRLTSLNKMMLPGLKRVCEVLDIERSGTKAAIIERIMDFLMKPTSSGLSVPEKKKRKSKGSGDAVKKGAKRKRAPKKKETKSKASKNKEALSDLSDSEDQEEEEEEEEEEEKKEEKNKKSESEEEEEEEEEDEPPKKKAKTEKKVPAKKEAPKKETPKAKKQNGKSEKAAKVEKKEPKKKKKVPESDESDSDDEPLAPKKNEPPSNSDLKDIIKKILDGANLEEVTMKTVVKQVYEKYPSFDLTDRKDFIKTTVREIIS